MKAIKGLDQRLRPLRYVAFALDPAVYEIGPERIARMMAAVEGFWFQEFDRLI